MSAIMLGVAAVGTLVATAANFFGAAAKNRAAKENYNLDLENIEEQRKAGSDQIQQFNEQGEGFMGTQTVNSATSGVTGASSSLALNTSKGNILKDSRRMQEQLAMNIDSAKKKAKINKDLGIADSNTMVAQGAGSLLTSAGNTYGQGRQWGVFK